MVLGGVLALLVAQLFGKNADTDAFFATYGIYSVGLTFAQTFRLTAVARLVNRAGAAEHAEITQLVLAVVLVCLLLAVPMVALAGPVGELLVDDDPNGIAPGTLRILWVALAGQLVAAMLATVLTVRGAFVAIGVVSMLSPFLSLATFLACEGAVGVRGAAIGLAVSACAMAAAYVVVLWRMGWRPEGARLASAGREAGRLTYGSATFIGTYFAYVICVALATRHDEGEATLFAYAFVIASVLVGLTANVSAMVRSPGVVASEARVEAAAGAGVNSFRFTLVLIGPVVGLLLLAGGPVIELALGAGFSAQDVRTILITMTCFLGWVLGSAAGVFAIVELLARGELRRLALLAVAQVVAVSVLATAGGALLGIEGIALALSAVQLVVAGAQLTFAFGGAARQAALDMVRATGRELVVVASAFAVPTALVLIVDSVAMTFVAAVVAAILVACATWTAWPAESRTLTGILRRR